VSRPTIIAVDAVGGDFAPSEIVSGVESALGDNESVNVALVGPDAIITPVADRWHGRVIAVSAPDIIGMDEHPASAIRTKKESSIVVGCKLVRDGQADAFFSAGSTGAMMAGSTLVMGRIPGVSRPAIATVLPTAGSPVVMLDVGANADCRAEHLVQFARMGVVYARTVLEVDAPRVALLNIGEEPSKGSALTQEVHALLSGSLEGFVGNIEGREMLHGHVDVIVTDGFTGNVALKLLEGTTEVLFGQIKEVMTSTPLRKLAASVLRPGLVELKRRLDPDVYGGAPLLGVNGVSIIGHGSSSAQAVHSALRAASRAVESGLTASIKESLT
jgi:glycerol-3-phosphate acyltransferase PlsX